ncbi:hypothetical protein AB4Z03_25580 [Bacillus sp. YAF12_1]
MRNTYTKDQADGTTLKRIVKLALTVVQDMPIQEQEYKEIKNHSA